MFVVVVGLEERYCTPLLRPNRITEIQNAIHRVIVSLENINDTVYKNKGGI